MFWFKKKRIDSSILGEIDRINKEDIEMLKEIDRLSTEVLEMSNTSIKHVVDNAAQETQVFNKQEANKLEYTRRDIARELNISPKNVHNYCIAAEKQGNIDFDQKDDGTKVYSRENAQKIMDYYRRLKSDKRKTNIINSKQHYYSIKDIADMIGVSRNTIKKVCMYLEDLNRIDAKKYNNENFYSRKDIDIIVECHNSKEYRRPNNAKVGTR